ncbi:hypothetical protein [Desulfonatronovibrio hydrogenovorans]|uniref:hypothetical protein n=1 Tax=Desulfonatronovibrio hydrogenovorans TaxID=53245 RepID=UPI001237676B|nr:hypothetical protein [Desulfonatronovibrio hydrogenovorans]
MIIKESIRKFCVECAGGPRAVHDCQGDFLNSDPCPELCKNRRIMGGFRPGAAENGIAGNRAMFKDRNKINRNNSEWRNFKDPGEIDDLMSLALRDLKRKFNEPDESRFEKVLDPNGYPDSGHRSE